MDVLTLRDRHVVRLVPLLPCAFGRLVVTGLWTLASEEPPFHKTPTRDPSEAAPHRRIFLAWVPLPQEGKHPRVRRLRTSRGVHLNKLGQKYTGLMRGGNPLEG